MAHGKEHYILMAVLKKTHLSEFCFEIDMIVKSTTTGNNCVQDWSWSKTMVQMPANHRSWALIDAITLLIIAQNMIHWRDAASTFIVLMSKKYLLCIHFGGVQPHTNRFFFKLHLHCTLISLFRPGHESLMWGYLHWWLGKEMLFSRVDEIHRYLNIF